MKGVLFLGDRSLKLADFPDPSAGPREVVLEIKASGMCGSDLHIYRASGAETALGYHASSPVVAGHEPCGVVAEIGLGVSASEAMISPRATLARIVFAFIAAKASRPIRLVVSGVH